MNNWTEQMKDAAARAIRLGHIGQKRGATVFGHQLSPAEWESLLTRSSGNVQVMPKPAEPDKMEMHIALIDVRKHWTFRWLPKDVREHIQQLIGEIA